MASRFGEWLRPEGVSKESLGIYDPVPDIFDRLAVPLIFNPPAKHLVSLLRLAPRARVLDVGGGTGTAALLARESSGPLSRVVVMDPSLGMLRIAGHHGLALTVAGAVPGMPFPDAAFDVVTANFVLSHVQCYQAGLSDMARVLRRGGRLGLTAWGPHQSECRKLWQEIAESFLSGEEFDRLTCGALPWERRFSDAGHLGDALREAGFVHIEVCHAEYTAITPVDDFLALREITHWSRLMMRVLAPEDWKSFREQVRMELHNRYPDIVEDTRDAYLAVGVKPNR